MKHCSQARKFVMVLDHSGVSAYCRVRNTACP